MLKVYITCISYVRLLCCFAACQLLISLSLSLYLPLYLEDRWRQMLVTLVRIIDIIFEATSWLSRWDKSPIWLTFRPLTKMKESWYFCKTPEDYKWHWRGSILYFFWLLTGVYIFHTSDIVAPVQCKFILISRMNREKMVLYILALWLKDQIVLNYSWNVVHINDLQLSTFVQNVYSGNNASLCHLPSVTFYFSVFIYWMANIHT